MSSSFAHKRTRKRVQAAKVKARSELNQCGWEPHRIVQNDSIDLDLNNSKDTIQRVDFNDITIEEFRERFEKPGVPCIITGLTNNWAAQTKWTIPVSNLIKAITFNHCCLASL